MAKWRFAIRKLFPNFNVNVCDVFAITQKIIWDGFDISLENNK